MGGWVMWSCRGLAGDLELHCGPSPTALSLPLELLSLPPLSSEGRMDARVPSPRHPPEPPWATVLMRRCHGSPGTQRELRCSESRAAWGKGLALVNS